MVACGGSVLSALICCTQLPAHTKKTSSDKPAGTGFGITRIDKPVTHFLLVVVVILKTAAVNN